MNIIDTSDKDADMNTVCFKIDDGVKSTFRLIPAAGAACYLAVGVLVYFSLSGKIFSKYNLNSNHNELVYHLSHSAKHHGCDWVQYPFPQAEHSSNEIKKRP